MSTALLFPFVLIMRRLSLIRRILAYISITLLDFARESDIITDLTNKSRPEIYFGRPHSVNVDFTSLENMHSHTKNVTNCQAEEVAQLFTVTPFGKELLQL